MLAQIPLFDPTLLDGLLGEFRRDVRRLLLELCDELEDGSRGTAEALSLPALWFRALADVLKPEDWGGWKVVGWVEGLNDLLYWLDVQRQWARERDPRAFIEALYAECEEQFYEHGYREELFPTGEPLAAGFTRRLDGLCRRLAREVVDESLWLAPRQLCRWLARRGGAGRPARWSVPCSLGPNFERAEPGGCLPIGPEGACLHAPLPVRRALADPGARPILTVGGGGMHLRIGRRSWPILTMAPSPRWHWRLVPPSSLRQWGMTLGGVLVYGRDRTPRRVTQPPPGLPERIGLALSVIAEAWPEGAANLRRFTSRIAPLRARGVVSFSYRHRPGLSFINCFDRDQLDLIDDLIHENSHHHLNLLLRKYPMRRDDRHLEVFYSPWRRSLRPLHGILHAAFTFTMGALLFERLSRWGEGRSEAALRAVGLTGRDLLRARARCLEEVESVRYSIRDLRHAADRLGWLTPWGARLVEALDREIRLAVRRIAPHRPAVLRSAFGPALRRHGRELDRARAAYPPPPA